MRDEPADMVAPGFELGVTIDAGGAAAEDGESVLASAESVLWAATLGLTFEEDRFRPRVAAAAAQAVRLGIRLGQVMQSGPTGLELALMIDDPGLRRIALERELDDTTDHLRRLQAAIDEQAH